MDPLNDPQSDRPSAAAELVERAVFDIEASDDELLDALLNDLLCAAWGSPLARLQ